MSNENDVRILTHLSCGGILCLQPNPDTHDYDPETESLAVSLRCSRCGRVFITVFFSPSHLLAEELVTMSAEQVIAEAADPSVADVASKLAFQAMSWLDDNPEEATQP